MKPRIGISMNYGVAEYGTERAYIDRRYFEFIDEFMAIPIPIVPTENTVLLHALLSQLDGILFSGGLDLAPALWDEPQHPATQLVHPRRQRFDLSLYELARKRSLPILGICLGLQMINVVHGGSLYQHLSDHPGRIDHGCESRWSEHALSLNEKSQLRRWLQAEQITVASGHHQGINRLGRGLLAAATAPDGVVEAVELEGYRFLLGVQWHPERCPADSISRTIVEQFIAACSEG